MKNTNDLLGHLKEALTILTRIDNNLKEVKDTINLMLPIDDVGCDNHRFSKVVGYTGDGGVVFQCKNCKQTKKHYKDKKPTPEQIPSEEEWSEAIEHLQKIYNVRKYNAERNGIFMGWGHIQAIMERYLNGEKTKELYDEMRKLT